MRICGCVIDSSVCWFFLLGVCLFLCLFGVCVAVGACEGVVSIFGVDLFCRAGIVCRCVGFGVVFVVFLVGSVCVVVV